MGNPSKWEWSTNKVTAAQLLAEDSLSIPQIAQQLGTSESTVDRWKKVPEFQARIRENIAAFRAKFLECGLARKKRRLAALTDVYHRQQLIVSARGASAERKSHWSHCRTGAVTFMGMSATDIDGEGKQDFVALFARRSAEAHG